MMTALFWRDAAERAFKTFLQAIAAAVLAAHLITDIDWKGQLGLALTAAAASLATSVLSAGLGTPGTASLVDTTMAAHRAHRHYAPGVDPRDAGD